MFCVTLCTAELNFWYRSLTPRQNLDAIVDIERRIARLLLRRAMQQPVKEEAIEALPTEYYDLVFEGEADANTVMQRWREDNNFREAVTRALLNLPTSRGGAGIGSALVTRAHAYIAAKMDVLNLPLGALTHYGKAFQEQGRTPPVMGPQVFEELASTSSSSGRTAATSPTSATTRCRADHRLRDAPTARRGRVPSRRGASHQSRLLASPVFAVAQARVKQVVHMVDTYAAARKDRARGRLRPLACA